MFAKQLTLSIELPIQSTFDNFLVGNNAEVVATLSQLQSDSASYLYLWGPPGVGCSHLLQATCHRFIEQGWTTFYLSLKQWQVYPEQVLSDLETVHCLCLDDVEAIESSIAWQESLFHLFNRAKAAKTNLIIAGHSAPKGLPFSLADLTSRLSSGLCYHIADLSDIEKAQVLALRAESRGLVISPDVIKFLLSHSARDMGSLMKVLDRLDRASLTEKRRLTIPFVKHVLDW